MNLPAWIGIPGAILLLVFIFYGFRQGMKVTSKQEGNPPESLPQVPFDVVKSVIGT